jgi:hypothetical protein
MENNMGYYDNKKHDEEVIQRNQKFNQFFCSRTSMFFLNGILFYITSSVIFREHYKIVYITFYIGWALFTVVGLFLLNFFLLLWKTRNMRLIIFAFIFIFTLFSFVSTNIWDSNGILSGRRLSITFSFISFYLAFYDITEIGFNRIMVLIVRILLGVMLGYFLLASFFPFLPLASQMDDYKKINTDYLTVLSVLIYFITSALKDQKIAQNKQA